MSILKYFKNIPRSPSHRATGQKCNFFLQICNKVPGEKKGGLSPVGGATWPFFFRDLIVNLKKKITLKACRPMVGRPGDIFEIFQNGHIFLKF